MTSTHLSSDTATPSDATILSFWGWFDSVARRLDESGFEELSILEELDSWMKMLGGVAWELGPGEQASSALTITPDGDATRINSTLRIVALAPTVPGWEFYPARRPRPGALHLQLESDDGTMVEVDATAWRYVLFQYEDKKLELVMEQPNLVGLSEDERYVAAVITVDGLLGEALRLLAVAVIEPSLALSSEERDQANPIQNLATHVRQLWRG